MKMLTMLLVTLSSTTALADCPFPLKLESKWESIGQIKSTSFELCHNQGTTQYMLLQNNTPYTKLGSHLSSEANEYGREIVGKNVQGEVFSLNIQKGNRKANLATYINNRISSETRLVRDMCPRNYKLESSWEDESQRELYQVCFKQGDNNYIIKKNLNNYSKGFATADGDEHFWEISGKNQANEFFTFNFPRGSHSAELTTYLNNRISEQIILNKLD